MLDGGGRLGRAPVDAGGRAATWCCVRRRPSPSPTGGARLARRAPSGRRAARATRRAAALSPARRPSRARLGLAAVRRARAGRLARAICLLGGRHARALAHGDLAVAVAERQLQEKAPRALRDLATRSRRACWSASSSAAWADGPRSRRPAVDRAGIKQASRARLPPGAPPRGSRSVVSQPSTSSPVR